MPGEDKNFGGALVLDFRKGWRHVKTLYIIPVFFFSYCWRALARQHTIPVNRGKIQNFVGCQTRSLRSRALSGIVETTIMRKSHGWHIIRDPHVAINVLLFSLVIIHQGRHERKEIKFVFIQRLRIEITFHVRILPRSYPKTVSRRSWLCHKARR